jgi:hypothetical protein
VFEASRLPGDDQQSGGITLRSRARRDQLGGKVVVELSQLANAPRPFRLAFTDLTSRCISRPRMSFSLSS